MKLKPTALRVLNKDWNYSATQAELINNCGRAWYLKYIDGVEVAQAAAPELGNNIHEALDKAKQGTAFPDEYIKFVKAVKEYWPTEQAIPEIKFTFQSAKGFKFGGKIDLHFWKNGARLAVWDYKTSSNKTYWLTEDQLKENIQMMAYARWGVERGAKEIELRHLYITTKHVTPQVHPRDAEVTAQDAVDFWDLVIEPLLEKSLEIAKAESFEDVFPDGTLNGHCQKFYGGCPFREKCGLDSAKNNMVSLTLPDRKEGDMTLQEKLAALKAKSQKTAQAILGVVPPDAPPREQEVITRPDTKGTEPPPVVEVVEVTTVEVVAKPEVTSPPPVVETLNEKLARQRRASSEAPPNGAPRRGRPPKTTTKPQIDESKPAKPLKEMITMAVVEENVSVAKGDTDVESLTPSERKEKFETAIGSKAKKLTLYVDCIATKGQNKGEATLFEDWVAPLAEKAAEINKVADYRLVEYTSKAQLALEMRKAVKAGNYPSILQITSYSSGADVALEVLTPLASEVIRALKG